MATLPWQRAADPPTAPTPRSVRRRLGEVLVEQGLLTDEALTEALTRQADVPYGAPRKRLGVIVVETGLATEQQVAEALANALGLPLVDLNRVRISPQAARSLPQPVAERAGVLVLGREGERVTVAVSDPTNIVAFDDVRLHTRATELVVQVATATQVREHLARAWSLSEDSADVTSMLEGMQDDSATDSHADLSAVESAPMVRLVDSVIADAVRGRASDIHVEPQLDGVHIRYRVDGLLREVMTVPRNAASALVSRLKIMSGLDIAERRRPQDGRARLTVDGRSLDARVSTLPSLHGEKVVVRLLPPSGAVPPLSALGLAPEQLAAVETAFTTPQGLVLITGPTGSGKTSTLYASIQEVSHAELNVVTLEDPVEIQLPGITQVQISEKSGLTFAAGLRSVLRQDPDIVLVGEVRDTETAELALQAALTGHLVLTTLHTTSAVSALTRLVDMGVEPLLVASSLTLVVAQRLVRRPCATCAAPCAPDERTLVLLGITPADLAGATLRKGLGCADCGGTGYRGRRGVFEVMPVTGVLRELLLTTPTESALLAGARAEGMRTLRGSALVAARAGETTLEEVVRVTQADAGLLSCASCAQPLVDGMVVCPCCASEVPTSGCAGCGKPLKPDWHVCPWCRARR